MLGAFVQRLGYAGLRADTLEALDRILGELRTIRFALVDFTGFDAGLWQRCARMHERNIPLLIISPRQSAAVRQLSLACGARGVLTKPLAMRELADTIHGFMQAEPLVDDETRP